MKKYHKPFITWQDHGCNKQKRQDHRHGCDGQSLIIFAVFACFTLPLCFHHIKICKADQACQSVEQKDRHSINMIHSKFKAKYNGQNTEADDISQGIDLDAKAFLFICPVLLCSGNFSVKHIAQSGKSQTAHSCSYPVCHGTEYSDHGRHHAYVSHYYCVIIKTNHLHTSFSVTVSSVNSKPFFLSSRHCFMPSFFSPVR